MPKFDLEKAATAVETLFAAIFDTLVQPTVSVVRWDHAGNFTPYDEQGYLQVGRIPGQTSPMHILPVRVGSERESFPPRPNNDETLAWLVVYPDPEDTRTDQASHPVNFRDAVDMVCVAHTVALVGLAFSAPTDGSKLDAFLGS